MDISRWPLQKNILTWYCGLGLIHSTAAADTEEKKEARRKSIKLMEQYGSEALVRQAMPGMFSPASKSGQPALVERLIQMGMQCKVEALIAYYEAMIKRPERKAVLQKITVPVLFQIGKDDTAVPYGKCVTADNPAIPQQHPYF